MDFIKFTNGVFKGKLDFLYNVTAADKVRCYRFKLDFLDLIQFSILNVLPKKASFDANRKLLSRKLLTEWIIILKHVHHCNCVLTDGIRWDVAVVMTNC